MDVYDRSVLLVEDNPDDLELTLYALRQYHRPGCITVARDGAEALEALFGREVSDASAPLRPTLILLDLKLPKVDGLEVLEKIKGDPAVRMIPVVILTSSPEERDVVAGYGLGVNSFIVKPMDFKDYVSAVQAVGAYWLSLNHSPRPR
ncbi:MAG: hypothetical protein RLZZ387_3622 [Chloroflexota bacterium]|jgi:CheY-like chemotaxis protein